MPYGPYYRQRGAITGMPSTPEAIYGEDVRRPAIRTDDLYERYGEASPYEGQTANKRAISGIENMPTGVANPNPPAFTGTMAEDPNALSTFAFYQGLPGGRAPEGYQGLGRGVNTLSNLGMKALFGILGIPSFLINPNLISRAFISPLLHMVGEQIWGDEIDIAPEIYGDYGYENPLPGDAMSTGGEAFSGFGSPEGGFSGYGGEPM